MPSLTASPSGAAGGSIPFLVAASDAPDEVQAVSDYVCDGTADEVEINAAIADAQLASVYKPVIRLSEGTFNIAAPIDYLYALVGAPGGAGAGIGTGATFVKVAANMTGPVIAADHIQDFGVVVDATVTGEAVELYKHMSNVGIRVLSGSVGTCVIVYGSDAHIANSSVAHATATGFDLQAGGRVTFTGVLLEQLAGVGIAENAAGRLAISSCIFDSVATGIAAGSGILAAAGNIFNVSTVGIDNTGSTATLNSDAAGANTFTGSGTPIVT